MIISSKQAEAKAVLTIAELICAAARTAPKARGIDNLVTLIVDGDEKDRLAEEMRRIAQESGSQFFERDAACLDKSPLLILFGQKVKVIGVKPCGYCGHADCAASAKNGGACVISAGDLGIAIGSAVSTAALHHVDNRVMFSAGKAALNLGFLGDEVSIAYGLPLSISGKSPFFDR